MDHLHQELAPISDTGWAALEDDARSRLTTALAARKLVDFEGPLGWTHSSVDLGRVEGVPGPVDGVEAARRRVLPVVELRAAFTVTAADLLDVERGAPGAFEDLGRAARSLALAENVTVFHGFGAGEMPGITESSSHSPIELPPGVEQYPNAVARATDVLRHAGISGRYGLAIAPVIYTGIVETTEHGGYPLLEHLRQILGGPVVWAPGVAGGIVLSMRGGDFRLSCGQDVSIGYRSHDSELVRLYLEESVTFRVVEPDAAVALRLPG